MKSALKKALFGGEGENLYTIRYLAPKGIKMYLNPSYASKTILGLEELEIQKYFVEYSKICPYFLDIGSSNGYYGLFYKKYNPQGTVYSFEAQSRFGEVQRKHFEINNCYTDVHIINKFASDHDDDTHLSVNRLLPLSGQKILIKLDIDGGEGIFLNDIRALLSKNDCYLVVETHGKQLEKECLALMADLGYKTRIIDIGWYRAILPERRDAAHFDQNRWFVASKR